MLGVFSGEGKLKETERGGEGGWEAMSGALGHREPCGPYLELGTLFRRQVFSPSDGTHPRERWEMVLAGMYFAGEANRRYSR